MGKESVWKYKPGETDEVSIRSLRRTGLNAWQRWIVFFTEEQATLNTAFIMLARLPCCKGSAFMYVAFVLTIQNQRPTQDTLSIYIIWYLEKHIKVLSVLRLSLNSPYVQDPSVRIQLHYRQASALITSSEQPARASRHLGHGCSELLVSALTVIIVGIVSGYNFK